jgi:hypothetical protein
MSSVNLEGLTPEASVAALQQLNYDLTMQLDLYQTMVTRLKDQMESVDTEKADLEADKLHLQQQLSTLVGNGAGGARGFGSWWRGRSRRPATAATGAGAGVGEGPSEAGEEGEWDRSTVGGDETMSVAGSLRSTLSGDLDAATAAAGPADSASTSAAAASSSSDGQDAATASSGQQATGAVGAVGSMAAAAGRLVGRLSRGPSASGAGGPAAGALNPEVLSRHLREARHQAQAVAEDNKVLVSKLVESQMELADAQGELREVCLLFACLHA